MGDRGEQGGVRSTTWEAAERPVSKAAEALERGENDWTFVYNLHPNIALGPGIRRALAAENLRLIRLALDTDEPQGSSPTSTSTESGEGGGAGAGLDLDRLARDSEARALMVKTFLVGQDTGLRSPLTNAEVAILAADVLALVERVRLLEAVAEAASHLTTWQRNDKSFDQGQHAWDELRAALAAAGGGAHE